jgi:hypothetical protein
MSNIGFIYKISNCDDDEIYVGSTKRTIKQRFQDHIYNLNSKTLKNIKLYGKINLLGQNKFKVELLETVQFEDKYELYAREQFYMDELKPTLNIRPAPDKNYDNYQKHKEARLQWCKEHYQENREYILERVHRYADNNKEKISERGKTYRATHKDEIKERRSKTFVCECGSESLLDHKARHLRTKKHLKFMEAKENAEKISNEI